MYKFGVFVWFLKELEFSWHVLVAFPCITFPRTLSGDSWVFTWRLTGRKWDRLTNMAYLMFIFCRSFEKALKIVKLACEMSLASTTELFKIPPLLSYIFCPKNLKTAQINSISTSWLVILTPNSDCSCFYEQNCGFIT
jgi:hypothetical protein